MSYYEMAYFRTSSGRAPVEDYLDRMEDVRERAGVFETLAEFREHGPEAVGIICRHIEGKLWEIKIDYRAKRHRIFYVVISGRRLVLLHAYLKKARKAPRRELETARRRLNLSERGT
ncbi:type II toxin-antitoxin system RelE/ParE family toxin [Elusimicrobiota bacterium]